MSSMSLLSSVEYPFQSAFLVLKRLLNGVACVTAIGFTLTRIGEGVLYIGSKIGRCCVCVP